ncbi:M48 family metallopeptidase [Inquilinus sp.]|jgi:predicted metal-dependent hydrolase|uniref:M48 family metallopeptidase n=1 Tax=Inquilinus sp. TaxID=1932117 RepID=UPI003784650F
MPSQTRPGASPALLAVTGLDRPVALRRNARARRLSLRLDPTSGEVVVVAPPRVPAQVIADFVNRHAEWVRRRRAAMPVRTPFQPGAEIPILGVPHRIAYDPAAGRGVRCADGELRIGGPAEHLGARLAAWLRAEARRQLLIRSRAAALRLGVTVAAVSVRDTRSRWGSCASSGRLSYSWRLLLAPEAVLDYVVAHEVAHLVEMNHSSRFWAVVDRLHPDADRCRAWLKAKGQDLHLYG